jgi:hypothetical protein
MTGARALWLLVLAAASILSGHGCCSGCDGLVKSTSSRSGFIESYNESTLPDCTLVGEGTDLVHVTLTCTDHTYAEVETMILATCTGYELVGFETVTIVGSDGRGACDVTDGCSCSAD